MNCLDIITRAMRRIGVLAAGQLPREVEAQDALDALSGIYARLITQGAFGELTSIAAQGDFTAAPGQRIIISDLTTDVTLPETVSAPYPDTGQVAVPDCAIVQIQNHLTNESVTFIRDARANLWVDIDNLTLTSPAPLSRRDPNGLACMLALELADEYGQQPSEMTVRNAGLWQIGLTHNWGEVTTSPPGVYF